MRGSSARSTRVGVKAAREGEGDLLERGKAMFSVLVASCHLGIRILVSTPEVRVFMKQQQRLQAIDWENNGGNPRLPSRDMFPSILP